MWDPDSGFSTAESAGFWPFGNWQIGTKGDDKNDEKLLSPSPGKEEDFNMRGLLPEARAPDQCESTEK